MTTEKTKAELLDELENTQHALAAAHQATERAEAQTKKVADDAERRHRSLDSEARALAYCIQAIEHMRTETGRQGIGNTSQLVYGQPRYDSMTGQKLTEPAAPPIGSTPVGRIILNLAARYHVDLTGPLL